MCSRSSMQIQQLLAASTHFAAFIETMLVRFFRQQQWNRWQTTVFNLHCRLCMSRGKMAEPKYRFECYAILLEHKYDSKVSFWLELSFMQQISQQWVNIQYRPDLKISPRLMNLSVVPNQTLVSVNPSASNVGSMCKQFSVRTENSMIEGSQRFTVLENRSSYVLYVSGRHSLAQITWYSATDARWQRTLQIFINSEDVVLDFPPEANTRVRIHLSVFVTSWGKKKHS